MPIGAYNWYCVFCSLGTIARYAASIRLGSSYQLPSYPDPATKPEQTQNQPENHTEKTVKFDSHTTIPNEEGNRALSHNVPPVSPRTFATVSLSKSLLPQANSTLTNHFDSLSERKEVENVPFNAIDAPSEDPSLVASQSLRSSRVPSSRLGRLFHYGGLAASLSLGAATEVVRRASGQDADSSNQDNPILLTEANLNRLVSKLSKMRGAALKMGQFMSIQDTHVLSEDLERIFQKVQHAAHYMPNSQLEKVMVENLGVSWESYFTSFSRIPSHAASIGQVHSCVLCAKYSPTGKEEQVAVKVQFPNIERSISSDLGYLKLLLGASMLLPKGLFLDSTIKVFKEELADECDYEREAKYINSYRQLFPKHLDSRFKVPWVWEKSTKRVLVMERMEGVSIGGDIVKFMTQEERNELSERVIELCLKELFEFRMMQTDPNWSNFLWNRRTRQIELIDFGATREYSPDFTDNWLRLLEAAISGNRQECIDASLALGYFTGGENEAMTNAHILSMQLLGTPFRPSSQQPFSFARGSEWSRITEEIRGLVPIMLNNRLTPPPRESYSLNRKLSGAFLLAARLNGSVDCRKVWEKVIA